MGLFLFVRQRASPEAPEKSFEHEPILGDIAKRAIATPSQISKSTATAHSVKKISPRGANASDDAEKATAPMIQAASTSADNHFAARIMRRRVAPLRGERHGPRSGECGAEHREHREVGVQLDAG